MGTSMPGTGFQFAGSPINIVSQMPDCQPGATPVAFENWKRAYTIVTRKLPTLQVDPFSAGFCRLFKFEARIRRANLS
jgi:HK97 family phage major capsid protein